MPREADGSWPFSHGQRVAVGATHPVLLPAAMGGHTAAATSSSHMFLTLHQLQVGRGLAQPLGRSVGSWKGILCDAAASCALESFSPSCAVLGQGELLWGVTGVSRPTE